ncbi:putative membrane protein [Halomicrobium zhouii]|uniref:Putative membrane protein n=1 Tax=Halomicrobium zhouii TaxID=767519 RepID=A0A1I6L648_9EURY|nr:DUF368 domain-containing protein [Halomicrobium zhouii]SFR98965.1 putative membrane protein [Halomicrobium zhouii]
MSTPSDHATEDYTVRGSVPPLREWLRVYVIGLFMGSADAVPGVSGGTIALIAGIYERLITAVTAVTPQRFVRGVTALLPIRGGVSIPQALDVWEDVDGWFLIALLGGIFTAVIAVTGVVDWANEYHPRELLGFFFGLIAASAVILLRAIDIEGTDEIAAAVAGFAVAFLASGINSGGGDSSLLVVFVAGAFSVSAMILPGISGSLMLVILGLHAYLSAQLHAFLGALTGLVSGGSPADVVGSGSVVVAFIVGGLIGVLTIARIIRRALDANHGATLAFLVALVVGALRAPVFQIGQKGYAWNQETLLLFGGAAAVGAVIVLVLDWYAVDIDLDAV